MGRWQHRHVPARREDSSCCPTKSLDGGKGQVKVAAINPEDEEAMAVHRHALQEDEEADAVREFAQQGSGRRYAGGRSRPAGRLGGSGRRAGAA